MTDTPAFIMFCGVPASGKSTAAARYLEERPETVVISSDARIEALAEASDLTYQAAYAAYAEAVKTNIRQDAALAFAVGKSLLWDQTNLTVAVRAEILAMVPSHYIKRVAAFEASDDVLAQRLAAREARQSRTIPQDVLAWQKENYIRPDKSEGWDHISVHVARLP